MNNLKQMKKIHMAKLKELRIEMAFFERKIKKLEKTENPHYGHIGDLERYNKLFLNLNGCEV